MSQFSVAGGSVIGRNHRLAGRNNQDAWHVVQGPSCTVAVVADGCGSGRFSEIGAGIGARLLAECLTASNLLRAERTVLSHLDLLARAMGGDYRSVVQEYFLFTLIGVRIDQAEAVFFACGDGTVIVDGCDVSPGHFEDNAPPYLGYQLLVPATADNFRLRIVARVPTWRLKSFLIGTDGVTDLQRAEECERPGLSGLVGPLKQFWQSDRYFRANPELVSRELRLIGRDWPQRDPVPGLLADDTTLVVGRQIDPTTEPGEDGT